MEQIDGVLLGLATRKLRRAQKPIWNQKALASKASVSPSTIAHLETGRIGEPTPETADAIAKAFGFESASELLRRTPVTDDDRRQARDIANDWSPEVVDELVRRTASMVLTQMTPNSDAAVAYQQGLDHQDAVLAATEGMRVQPSDALRLIPPSPDVAAGGGSAGGLDDDGPKVYMHPDEIGGRNLTWSWVRGDCMSPWIEEGYKLIYEVIDRRNEHSVANDELLVLVLYDEGPPEGAHVVKYVRWVDEAKAVLTARDGSEKLVDMNRARIIGRYVGHRSY